MVPAGGQSYFSIIPRPVLFLDAAVRNEDRAMTQTNVIDFELAAQRRREQLGVHAADGSHHQAWRSRYREGIDGLLATRQLGTRPDEILPFVTARSRQPVKAELT